MKTNKSELVALQNITCIHFSFIYSRRCVMESYLECLSRLVVHRLLYYRSTLQFAVIQMELFRHLSPILRIEKIIRSTLVRRCLFNQHHARNLRDPHFLFRMVAPLSTVTANERKKTHTINKNFGMWFWGVDLQLGCSSNLKYITNVIVKHKK